MAVVAPASPFDREMFDAGVAEIRRLGFEPVHDESVFARQGYVAGPAETRAAAIRDAWADPTIKAVVAARGGYGSVQVLPLLDVDAARRARTIFLGHSDLTSMLTFLTTRCAMVAFHGPMVAGELGRTGGYDQMSLLGCLTRAEPLGEIGAPGVEALVGGEAAGLLLGGTLSQLVASLDTPFAFEPPDEYVLFVDEVRERPYRVDRALTQLRLSGRLSKASAVVFGELPGCDEPGGEPSIRATLADLMRDFPGPVLFGLPSGHTATGADGQRQPALTLPLGVRARVVTAGLPRLVIEEAAVE